MPNAYTVYGSYLSLGGRTSVLLKIQRFVIIRVLYIDLQALPKGTLSVFSDVSHKNDPSNEVLNSLTFGTAR